MEFSLVKDLAFKYVFGKEEHAPQLKALLNALLRYEGDEKIQEIDIRNPFIQGKTETAKTVILDVRAKDAKSRHFTIEVQIKPQHFYVNRIVYYAAKVLADQLEKGDLYQWVNKVISISILDHKLLAKEEDVQHIYRLRKVRSDNDLTDVLEFHFIELPRFTVKEPPIDAALFDKWINLIKYSSEYVHPDALIPEALRREEEIMMALESFRRMSADEEMRMLLEEREKSERDLNSMLFEARLDGLTEGEHKGKLEGKLETAAAMFKKGYDRETVKQLTGLSDEELSRLKKDE